MKTARILLALALVLPAAALAQAPAIEPETIYSEAQRTRDELLSRKFVGSLLRPSFQLEGQFAKWKHPICPRVIGMTPLAAHVVERRIRDVAQQIGAPLDRTDPCKPNIRVFVSPEPQATLDAIAAKQRLLFDAAPLREMTVHYPIQAWYFGYIVDSVGNRMWDVDCWLHVFEPSCSGVSPLGNRIVTGVKPDMTVATIVVDSTAIKGLTLGAFGDYVALMALAQTPATGRCQPAPSIANLFLTGCETDFHTTSLSDADLAMLTALYQTPEDLETLQGNRMIANMRRNLEVRK